MVYQDVCVCGLLGKSLKDEEKSALFTLPLLHEREVNGL